MSEIANSEGASESEKPVHNESVQQFPPFPDPKDEDFDEDISENERMYYMTMFNDLNNVKKLRLHCTACDRHLGCAARNEGRMRPHPMLRTLVCQNCHIFYNSGEFEKGDDGSELYCRWCGQGGQVYCCSDCPHVFCAKCIKRNLGGLKIKEIESTDDWKCFKCNSRCLWDLRALCWAVLRFCDLKNKIAYQTQDLELREVYKKDCSIDYSECCKKKEKKTPKSETKKKEIKKEVEAKSTANIISKIPSTIQVKKFASVTLDDSPKPEKKAVKRSQSPKNKSMLVKHPITIAPCPRIMNPVSIPSMPKKIRLPNPPMMQSPVRFLNQPDRKTMTTYSRIRPKPPLLPVHIANSFNGFNPNIFNNVVSDNINLSLESLTQGLDMAAVAALNQNCQDDGGDVVCTPDFPMEPLCEVTEDNDDDVQCITPGPVVAPKIVNPPPLVPRTANNTSEVSSDNIIQMTENDVTVNAATGGLKFRVDPQTLSSNKMYRLPDGRIFAINANPNMPGGYSATIVAVTEPSGKTAPKGATYAAKLSAVSTSTPTSKANRGQPRILKRKVPKTVKVAKSNETPRACDLNVPVEWYRYNLVDAVDAVEYALSKLQKLKKEATTVYLRTRSVDEMRSLHRTLERLLNTTSSRFGEIRETLNKGMKQYILRKSGGNVSDDDDDVEILPDMDDNDDPIFIDENSMESNVNGSENQEVDLTGAGSSEYNDSAENVKDKTNLDPLQVSEIDAENSEHGDGIPDLRNTDNLVDMADTTRTHKNTNERDDTDDTFKENEVEDSVLENDTIDSVIRNDTGDNGKKDTTDDKLVQEEYTDDKFVQEECTDDKLVQEECTDDAAKNIRSVDIANKNDTDNKKDNETDINNRKNENNSKNKENESDIKDQTEIISKDSKADDNIMDNQTNDNFEKNVTTDDKEIKAILSQNDKIKEVNGEATEIKESHDKPSEMEVDAECLPQKDLNDKADSQDSEDKMQDTEISEEMIETLLKDDIVTDESTSNLNNMDVSGVLQET